jgi:hypothetical protein
MRSRQRPTKREDERGGRPHEVYEHPAYGVIGMSVVNGGGRTLFGSDIGHDQRIQIRIRRAELHRDLSHDWVHGRGRGIVEVEMSHSQFAEFITTPNRGEGITCTITEINGEMLPAIEQVETKQQLFRREIEAAGKQRLEAALTEVKRLGELIESGKTSKTELREIHKDLARELSYLPGSISYVVEQAEEALEKATTHAKIEIEATVNHHISRIGLDAARAIGLAPSTPTMKEIE